MLEDSEQDKIESDEKSVQSEIQENEEDMDISDSYTRVETPFLDIIQHLIKTYLPCIMGCSLSLSAAYSAELTEEEAVAKASALLKKVKTKTATAVTEDAISK